MINDPARHACVSPHTGLPAGLILVYHEADAARACHPFDDVFRAGTPRCGAPWQRRRKPAALLPASRRTPLRHGHAHGRDDGRSPLRIDAVRHRSLHLPAVSRLCCRTLDTRTRSCRNRSRVPFSAQAIACASRCPRQRACQLHPYPRQPRPSADLLELVA